MTKPKPTQDQQDRAHPAGDRSEIEAALEAAGIAYTVVFSGEGANCPRCTSHTGSVAA